MGKALITIGIIFIVVGILIHLLPGNSLPRLPGDVYIKEEKYSFYFPLGWSILISIVISVAFWLFNR